MNYSKVLKNPSLNVKPKLTEEEQKKYTEENLAYLYQKRKPSPIKKIEFQTPFQNLLENNSPIKPEGIGFPPTGYKASFKSLTTTKNEDRAKIVSHFY